MTDESGSRRHPRHPAGKGLTQVSDETYRGVPTWTTARLLDPIRAAALAAAVTLCREPDVSTREVLTVAKDFEQYLTDEEADDPTDHR